MSAHVVYRCYDAADRLLYVGCTHDLTMRMRYHRYRSHWFPQVARVAQTSYATRSLALAHETRAIVVESPAYNIASRHFSQEQADHFVVRAEAEAVA